ncbi:alkaline phosphatase family protein [Chloroflexota bacterium]
MLKRPKKVIVLGLDGPIMPRLYKYCTEGELPSLAGIIDNGVWAENAMVPLPTATPANWTSIATGAWPSTHGITDFNVHSPGNALDRAHVAFYSGDVKAEFVWNAIARAGKKSAVVNFPVTWPPVVDNGIQIGGAGVDVNQWFYPALLYGSEAGKVLPRADDDAGHRFAQHGIGTGETAPRFWSTLSHARLFSTRKLQTGPAASIVIEWKEPVGWSNSPPARRALEADLAFRPAAPLYRMEPPLWHMLILDTNGEGFDRAIICDAKDAASPMAELGVGQWSPVIMKEFHTEAGPKKACFALKLLELSKDAQDFRLYHSAICALDGWSYPESLAAEINSQKGLPDPDGGFFGFELGWFDADTLGEIVEMQRQWYSDACTHILKNKSWDLFIIRYHLPDTAWHSLSRLVDHATANSDLEGQRFRQLELMVYQACDRLAADLIDCVDEDETLIVLVSDHGAKVANGPAFNANNVLEGVGLLVRDKDGHIDWSKTKAAARPVVWVYVNLKGRDPQGIVEPGDEYRQVQDQVIKALTDYAEPTTGRKPVLFALRKDDARFINIYGDYAGDIVYAISEHFGGQHGPFLPSAELGLSSMQGLLAMAGPGVRRGVKLKRNVWCLDLMPTICYLAGWPVPKDAEGAVIWQALEETDLNRTGAEPEPRWG